MCPTTRHPEAFPLKNITTKTIANTLINMFTTYGIPKNIQSDRGSNFTSDLFRAVLGQLGITQTFSTAYHPQSQGALERCHQTQKSVHRKYCHENDQEWDEALPFALFAIRETTNETLGVSPFEMLFGRPVREPLKVIKEKLLSETAYRLSSVIQYINHLKDSLHKIHEFAKRNLPRSHLIKVIGFLLSS